MLSFLGVIFSLVIGAVVGVIGLYFIACKNPKIRQFIIDKLSNCNCSDGKCS